MKSNKIINISIIQSLYLLIILIIDKSKCYISFDNKCISLIISFILIISSLVLSDMFGNNYVKITHNKESKLKIVVRPLISFLITLLMVYLIFVDDNDNYIKINWSNFIQELRYSLVGLVLYLKTFIIILYNILSYNKNQILVKIDSKENINNI